MKDQLSIRPARLVLRMTRRAMICAVLLIAGCGQQDPTAWLRPDIGPRLHQHGRPARWESSTMDLGQSGFTAQVGYEYYQDDGDKLPDHYTIDVEFRSGTGSYVAFQRDLAIGDLPPGFADDIVRIVAFDARTRIVVFTLGPTQFRYVLPHPPGTGP